MRPYPTTIALTIAGSDSGGGAGIQADLKTFQAFGVHGTAAITSITSQNTRGVSAVHAVPVTHVRSQIEAVFADFPVAAVKTGMLGSSATARAVVRELRKRRPPWLVVDPVMIATSGARLLDERAITIVRDALIPLADLLTPNVPEAEALLERHIRTPAEFDQAAANLRAMGAAAVLLKGGHAKGAEVVDRYYDAKGKLEFRHTRLPLEAHGTGCTLAAAIAAGLAKGLSLREAVRRGIAYVQRSLARGYRVGGGNLLLLGH